jgi:uncharacterized UBP type Zn finger protein
MQLPKPLEKFLADGMRRSIGTSAVQPIVAPTHQSGLPRPPRVQLQPSAEALQQLIDMGFEATQAERALVQTGNNFELALQLLL